MMKSKLFIIIVLYVFSVPSISGALTFEQAGFKIDALEAPAGTSAEQPIMMLLPRKNGFAASVNVQVQSFNDTLANYKKSSDIQFEQAGLVVKTSELKGDALTFEYVGEMNKHKFHWYSRAYKKNDFIYLVTATSLEIDWFENEEQLITTVNSFELNK